MSDLEKTEKEFRQYFYGQQHIYLENMVFLLKTVFLILLKNERHLTEI